MTLSPFLRVILWPLSLLYGRFSRMRARFYATGILKQNRLGKPVISIGNLTAGGTGKTPMVIWLAERLLAEGHRVGILSRGYKGSGGTSDEIDLMRARLQNRAEFGVGANRYENGKRLESSVDLFLLDDGFQHLALARDIDILLIDASQSLARQTLLPTGRLREPVSAMARADILIFTRAETVPGAGAAIEILQDFPVFSASTRLLGFRQLHANSQILPSPRIGSGPFYAFCGIGNARAFFQDLQNWQLSLADRCEFPDHHGYDARDARELEVAARRAGANALLTTEKDAHNLASVQFASLPVYVAIIDFEIPKAEALLSLVHQKLQATVAAA
jgi:tetraacyldisaccharide 4'-kinase